MGVGRVIAEARVTRATFYRHFPGEKDLVTAYLQAEDQRIRARVDHGVRHAGSAQQAI